ncbi:hypothetical protein NDU88_004416 [Pleurodeles waltl]|uniref:Uncharacterized protein n=1 Tax=Pleurodeles waltl TaxID=8319 RepID=A0AAV7LL91_PLEWA|nr:hypothetical protein NDU88_004416 [Pleurodeles waltl]
MNESLGGTLSKRVSVYHHDLTDILIGLPAEPRPAPLPWTWSGGLTVHQGKEGTSARPIAGAYGGRPTSRQKRIWYSLPTGVPWLLAC